MTMRRGGRAVRDWYERKRAEAERAARIAAERAAVARVLSAEPWLCWICETPKFRLSADAIVVRHADTCPCYLRPEGYDARECTGYVAGILVMAGLRPVFDGDYWLDGRIVHRRVRAPA
jgi:hypothetical protein